MMKQALLLILFLCLSIFSYAKMSLFSPTGGIPIDISSDDGMEIDRVNQVITASGNAIVIREDMRLHSDKLMAYYEEDENNNTLFWRLDAKGNLKIVSPQGQLTGDHGIYDVKQEIIVIYASKDRPIIIRGEQGTARAERQLEYYATERRIIARGNVKAIQDEQKIEAEVLEIILIGEEDNKDDIQASENISELARDIEQIRAYSDVILKTPDGTVTGDRAIWFAQTQKATITGNVQIKQAQNILNGCRGEVDTKTGSARLIGGDCDDNEGRITGRFKDKEKDKE